MKNMVTMVVVLTAMMTTTMLRMAKCELHYVGGGKIGWAPHVNFSQWSSHERFYVGDWLYFGFDKNMYNVLEVNKSSYENCIDSGFIKNITRGGRDVFQLTEPKNYYFLSGRGHCWEGLKLAINVLNDAQPSLPPLPPSTTSSSSSSSSSYFNAIQALLLSAATLWAIADYYKWNSD
ncbi:lamin-like protein [Senna tora]|uniref:Lamin-like protein n=1 Tax=Senna tora TaxID=362788 RepID=A0A834T7Q5_9FABA|nr:lamin-like protein [Senna tora]